MRKVRQIGFLIVLFCALAFNANAQNISTIAGGGTSLGNGVPATVAKLGVTALGFFDASGNYYFADGAGKIKMIDKADNIYTIAGTSVGFGGDGGPATAARIEMQGASMDTGGNIYIADFYNSRIRKIDAMTKIITTIAGTGISGYSPDGSPSSTSNIKPSAVWSYKKTGEVFFIDGGGLYVRKIDAAGRLKTVVGNGIAGGAGDGGPATAAELATTNSYSLDEKDNLYLPCGTKIRKVNLATGIISAYAGTGYYLYVGDGIPATTAQFNAYQLGYDTVNDNLYIADDVNDRVYKIDAAGIFYLVAGTSTFGFSGDGGPATGAELFNPQGVCADACGNTYIADGNNGRIRKVSSGTTITPSISITSGTSYASGSTVTVTAAVTDTCASYLVRWFNKGVLFATTTTTSVTYTKGAGIDTITARVVPQCGSCYDSTTSLQHIVYNSALGINGTALQPVHIYPNPAKSELSITTGSNITGISISNIIGRQVYSHEYSSQNVSINIAHLPAGVYTVRIIGDGWQEVKRVVKE